MFSINILVRSFIASAVLPLLAASVITLYALMFQPHKSPQASNIALNYWIAFLLFSVLTVVNNALTYRLFCAMGRIKFSAYVICAGFFYGLFFTYLAWDEQLTLTGAFLTLGIYGIALGSVSAAIYYAALIKGIKKNKHPRPGLFGNALLFTAIVMFLCKLIFAQFTPLSGLGSYLALKAKPSLTSYFREVPPGKILISSHSNQYPGEAYFDFLFDWWWLFIILAILVFVYSHIFKSN